MSPSDPQPATPSLQDESDAGEDFGSPSVDETPETPTATSSRESTRPPRLLDAGVRKGYERTIKTAALAASGLVDARMGEDTGAFLMEPDEAQNIAEPASRILARHAPLPGGEKQATDLADGVELITAIFGYVMSALARRTQAFAGGHLTATADAADGDSFAVEDTPPPAVRSWPAGPPTAPMIGGGQ